MALVFLQIIRVEKARKYNNSNVCMNFFWPEMERQIRINGRIKRLSEQESDDYFNSRPYKKVDRGLEFATKSLS